MSRCYAGRRYAGGLGPSRVHTRIPTTRRLGQWMSLRKILRFRVRLQLSQSRCLSLLLARLSNQIRLTVDVIRTVDFYPVCVCVFFPFILDIKFVGHTSRGHTSSSSSSSPLYCLRENISFDTLIRRSSRGHNSRKATQPSHCGTCLILLIFIAKRVQPSLPSSTLRSNFVYPRQISRSPRVGHCMS